MKVVRRQNSGAGIKRFSFYSDFWFFNIYNSIIQKLNRHKRR